MSSSRVPDEEERGRAGAPRSSSESLDEESEEGFALLSDPEEDSEDDLADGKEYSAATKPAPARSPQSESSLNANVIEARAREHTEAEHALTLRQAINAYPMAIFWCLIASTCVIMEGYDTIL